MNEPQFTEPIFNQTSIILPEHKKANILAGRSYLVVCFREGQSHPFLFNFSRGAEVISRDMPEHYKFYLLPEEQHDDL